MGRFEEQQYSRWVLGVVAVMVIIFTMSACLKDDEGVNQISAVRALNAVPASTQLDIGLDGNKLNYDQYTGRDEDFAYLDTLPYKNAWPGNRLVRVFDPKDGRDASPVVQGTVGFTPGKFYSLYVVGYETIELMATEDDLSAPAAGKAKLRFIHLSPDAPALDFGVVGREAPLATNKAFKSVEGFFAIDAGEAYTFSITDHGTKEVLHTVELTPEPGVIYTVWVRGLLADGGDEALAFGHEVIIH